MEIEVATSSARRGPWLLNAAAVALMALAAGWRRRYPLLFLAVVGGLAVALSGGLTSLDRSTVTGLYSPGRAAIHGRRLATPHPGDGRDWRCGRLERASSLSSTTPRSADFAGAVVMGVVVWTAGRPWRAQRILNAELTETTAQLAAERDQRAELAVATERTRIARELHGLVAHGVVTMVVQAEAAGTCSCSQPEDADAAIRDIEQTGRDALTQLRRILGVLRSGAGTLTPTRSRPRRHHLFHASRSRHMDARAGADMTVRVVIADDQQLVRAGFAMILSTYSDIDVVGEATNGHEAVTLAASLAPDVVLMDIQMPGINGIEATRRIVSDTQQHGF